MLKWEVIFERAHTPKISPFTSFRPIWWTSQPPQPRFDKLSMPHNSLLDTRGKARSMRPEGKPECRMFYRYCLAFNVGWVERLIKMGFALPIIFLGLPDYSGLTMKAIPIADETAQPILHQAPCPLLHAPGKWVSSPILFLQFHSKAFSVVYPHLYPSPHFPYNI